MASLSFEGETHDEVVLKVRRWLASVDGTEDDAHLTPVEAVERGAEITKEALRVIASAAPGQIADSDVVKSLTSLGYRVTDQTRDAVVSSLDALAELTGGGLVQRAEGASRSAVYEMNKEIARHLLRSLRS